MITERNYKMDNMKALMMYLVVFGHMLECFHGTVRWWIYLAIYSFHMPVFAYITGYFSRINPERTVKGILYPYFLYQTLYLMFQRFFLEQENILQFTTPYWLLWYLISLLCWQMFLPLISWKGFTQEKVLTATFILSLAAGFDNTVGYYLSLSRTLVLLPFFTAGYFQYFDGLTDRMKRGAGKHLCLFGCVLCVLGIKRMSGVLQAGWMYHSMSYEAGGYSVWIRAGLLLTAVFWILVWNVLVPNRRIWLISMLGRYTMPVFLLHGFYL